MKKKSLQTAQEKKEMPEFTFTDDFKPFSGSSSYLNDLHRQALKTYRAMSFPDGKKADWRKVKWQDFNPKDYVLLNGSSGSQEKVDFAIPENYSKEMTLIQKLFSEKGTETFCPEPLEEGFIFGSTVDKNTSFPEKVIKKIGSIVKPDTDKFSAFGFAFSKASTVMYVENDIQLANPVFYQEKIQGEKLAIPGTMLIYLGRNSSATVIRQQKSEDKQNNFNSEILEIYLEEGARLEFLDLSTNGKQTWNFIHERAEMEKDAFLNWFTLLSGSGFSKSNLRIDLNGKGSQALITGLFLPEGQQRFYMDTYQSHMKENTTSDLLYRGVIDGESQSRWQGMIYVDEKALRTDGYQADNNLILSKTAKIDAIPGLEILTDDVRCSHGVTITNIDDEQLFYLKSRGILEEEGIDLVVSGFIRKAIDRISSETLKKMISGKFISRINKVML